MGNPACSGQIARQYVVVILTSILYLGALAINRFSGLDLTKRMVGLSVFAGFLTLGRMKVISFDRCPSGILPRARWLGDHLPGPHLVTDKLGLPGILNGFRRTIKHVPDPFLLILKKDKPNYLDLPGLTVLMGRR